MYPKAYLDLFRDFERKPQVFVATPFSNRFEPRWTKIFRPAIEDCSLKPLRIKDKVIGDSIPTEILDGIGTSKLVLVDISTEYQSETKSFPNPNVMYELGIAHSIRLAEEVIVVKDERAMKAPFDINHIRWNEFSEGRPAKARRLVRDLLRRATKEIDLLKDHIVAKTASALDPDMVAFLHEVRGYKDEGFDLAVFDPDRNGLYGLPNRDCEEGYLRDLARALISLGVLRSLEAVPYWQRVYGGTPEYTLTALGKTILSIIPDLTKKPTKQELAKWRRRIIGNRA